MNTFHITDEQLAQLRALRLWHWQGVMYRRNAQRFYEDRAKSPNTPKAKENAEWQERQANFHMKQVQLLNDFFPVGDTAEIDSYQVIK